MGAEPDTRQPYQKIEGKARQQGFSLATVQVKLTLEIPITLSQRLMDLYEFIEGFLRFVYAFSFGMVAYSVSMLLMSNIVGERKSPKQYQIHLHNRGIVFLFIGVICYFIVTASSW